MKRLFIDCTSTYYSGLNTGMQRTVKKIIENRHYFSSFDEVLTIAQLGSKYYHFTKKVINLRLLHYCILLVLKREIFLVFFNLVLLIDF